MSVTVHPDQLRATMQATADAADALHDTELLSRLRTRQRVPISDGPARIVRDLVERGLAPDALLVAAALADELDRAAAERRLSA